MGLVEWKNYKRKWYKSYMKNKEIISQIEFLLEHTDVVEVQKQEESLKLILQVLKSGDSVILHPTFIQKVNNLFELVSIKDKEENSEINKEHDPLKQIEESLSDFPTAKLFIKTILNNIDIVRLLYGMNYDSENNKVLLDTTLNNLDDPNQFKDFLKLTLIISEFIDKNYKKELSTKIKDSISFSLNLDSNDIIHTQKNETIKIVFNLPEVEIEEGTVELENNCNKNKSTNNDSNFDSSSNEELEIQDKDKEEEISLQVQISDSEQETLKFMKENNCDFFVDTKTLDDSILFIQKTFGDSIFTSKVQNLIDIRLPELEFDLGTATSALLEKEIELDSLCLISFKSKVAVFLTGKHQEDPLIFLGKYDNEKLIKTELN